MAKDAKGHGSETGGAHSAGVNAVGQPVHVVSSVLDTIRKNPDGFSVTPGGKQPSSGYQVAVPGRTQFVNPQELSNDRLSAFANQHADLFQNPSMHIGGWHDSNTGKFHLDPSENIKGRNAAVAAGRSRNQISIWDVKNKREIPTGGTGG